MGEKEKVMIMRCEEYSADRIRGIIREGMETLGAIPRGRVLFKPNVVLAHPELFPHAFTRAEFLDGAIAAAKDVAGEVEEFAVGERSGITIPTRYCFKNAEYLEVIKRHGAKAYFFDESRHVPFRLRKPGRLRDLIYVPKEIIEADFLVSLPKFKAHPWTRLTLSLKNYIGLQDDRHRLVDHNTYLEHKIVDLQEIIQPSFIAIDAIVAGQKMMLTPTPFNLGAIVMGTNPCAVDTVGCHMVHVDPKDLLHLQMASQRGYGPMDLGEIEVLGDFPLEEVRAKTKDFQFCLERIDSYFKESNLSCTVGSFPEAHSRDYCWGGCPGAAQEAMHILRDFYPDVDRTMKKVHYVVGRVDGPIELQDDEKVFFAGDCTSWQGMLKGRPVSIDPRYMKKEEVKTQKTKSNDLLLKTFQSLWECFTKRNMPYVRAKGCPVSVADHVNFLSALGGIKNPNFDPRLFLPVTLAYFKMRLMRVLNRFMG